MKLSKKITKYIRHQISQNTLEDIQEGHGISPKDRQKFLKRSVSGSQEGGRLQSTGKNGGDIAYKFQFIAILAIAFLSIIIYYSSLDAPFVFDDIPNIVDNPFIRITNLDFKQLYNAGFKSRSQFRPVANISFALNYYFHKYNTLGYHIINIFIHILTGIFLYCLLNTTLSITLFPSKCRSSAIIALISVLLWLSNPVQTQAVTYIVQRMTIMASMFFILSFFLYVKGRLAAEKWKSRVYLFGSVTTWILALGCKQISATLPFFIFLYEYYFLQDLNKYRVKRRLIYVLGIFILFCLIALVYLGLNPFEKIASLNDYANKEFSYTERLLTQFRVIIYYLSLIIWPSPSRLNLDYDFSLSHSLVDPPATLFCLIAIIGLIGLAFYLGKRDRLTSFGIFWFLGNLAIESSFIPLAIIFEHRIYLPSMFVWFLFVIWIYKYVKQQWLIGVIFSVVVLLFSFWTYERNIIWSDEIALWKDCVEKSPNKARPYSNLGLALQEQGRLDESIKHYEKALRIKPDCVETLYDLGNALKELGRIQDAINYYKEALQIRPDNEEIHYNLGNALKEQGRPNEAISHFEEALRIRPDYKEVYNNLGNALVEQRRLDEAVKYYEEALRIMPGDEKVHYNMGNVLQEQGYTDDAIQHYQEALRIKPDFVEADYNLANALQVIGRLNDAIRYYKKVLLIKPDHEGTHYYVGLSLQKLGRMDEAIRHYQIALSIKPDDEKVHNNMAVALYLTGDIDGAIKHFQMAVQLNPDYTSAKNNLEKLLINRKQKQ